MAPVLPPIETNSSPLADYFFICGIESSQVSDEKFKIPVQNGSSPPPAVNATIEENEVLEVDPDTRPKSTELESIPSNEAQRQRMSWEARKSICSIIEVGRHSTAASNRSSATIKGAPAVGGSGLSDQEFESALRKFASERDSFLEEIQFSAGAIARPAKKTTKARPKTQRIVSEEVGPAANLSRGMGTLKRRISVMSSLKRQPSVARQGMRQMLIGISFSSGPRFRRADCPQQHPFERQRD